MLGCSYGVEVLFTAFPMLLKSYLLSTLTVKHWMVNTEDIACLRCLLKFKLKWDKYLQEMAENANSAHANSASTAW